MSEHVSAYYDGFLREKMVSYRLYGNRRIDLAFRSIRPLLQPGAVVADIGCGIGMISEKIARLNAHNRVIGIDLSPANIEYARRTVSLPNAEFVQSDASGQLTILREKSPEGYDLLAFVDVIEHLPEKDRPSLFRNLRPLLKPGGALFLSWPSPEYQRYLMENEPHHLQVIDNAVSAEVLISEAASAGVALKSLSYLDVWRKNQYLHAVFVDPAALTVERRRAPSLPVRIFRHGWQRALLPVKQWKYLVRPFRDWPEGA